VVSFSIIDVSFVTRGQIQKDSRVPKECTDEIEMAITGQHKSKMIQRTLIYKRETG
jgi:hypothetical protein